MSKTTSKPPMKPDWRGIAIIVVAIIIGFAGGMVYSRNHTTTQTSTTKPSTITPICNCPNLPVGGNPAVYCKC